MRASVLAVLAFTLGAGTALAQPPAPDNWWSQAGGEKGPTRLVWAAHKNPETPYTGPNKPIWHIADILKAHRGQARWEQQALLTRDFNGTYVQMAPGEKSKCMFYADDRVWGWVYGGQLKVTIDGQEPKVLPKGWAKIPPDLAVAGQTTGPTRLPRAPRGRCGTTTSGAPAGRPAGLWTAHRNSPEASETTTGTSPTSTNAGR